MKGRPQKGEVDPEPAGLLELWRPGLWKSSRKDPQLERVQLQDQEGGRQLGRLPLPDRRVLPCSECLRAPGLHR